MTGTHTRQTPRGAALLIVLAGLVMVMAIAAPAAQFTGLVARERRDAASELLLDDLLRDASRPIRHWLHEHSDRSALPPDARSPAARVLDDEFAAGAAGMVRIRITAYDQCGMAPWGTDDRALALSLPDDLRELVCPVWPGLDAMGESPERPAFPDPAARPEAPLACGELMATHNPPFRSGGRPAINVNTAPAALLEAALRSSGRGAIEAIRRSRVAGRPFSSFARAGVREDGAGPRIVGASDCWAFRVDLRAGSLARSWWEVHVLRGSEWVRVQRLAITE